MMIQSSLEETELMETFLKNCDDALFSTQVWPPNNKLICKELVITCNYLITCVCHQRKRRLVKLPHLDSSNANKLLLHTLRRVCQYLCHDKPSPDSDTACLTEDHAVTNQMKKIIFSLQNPLIHFKGLDIMGHLLSLVCIWCIYNCQADGRRPKPITYLIEMKKLASGPVLKEQIPQYHGFLMCRPIDNVQQVKICVPCVEDLMSLVFIVFNHPSNFAMEHEPWKWLDLCLQCQEMMKKKDYTNAMSKLHNTLESDWDPEVKARMLCLFADGYHKQGFHHLAIQAYRDALQVDNGSSSIFWYLSNIYKTLGKDDLELECLNLLVSMMSTNEEDDSVEKRIDANLDEIIWSIVSPVYNISLAMAIYTFARRGFQLKRYKESAEQYLDLVKKLKSGNIFPEFINESGDEEDVREIFVEAAEALLMAGYLNDCLNTASHVSSCLSVSDSFQPPKDPGETWNPFDDESDSPPLFLSDFNACHSSLDSHKNSKDAIDKDDTLQQLSVEGVTDSEDVSFWRRVTAGSKKRLRSSNANESDEIQDNNKIHLLKARAILCKSDALILRDGCTDQAFSHLSQALDVLLNHPSKPRDNSISSPSSKRQRISSDGVSRDCNVQEHKGRDNGALPECTGTSNWQSLMLNTALRMGKASLERQNFSSVISSCLLMLQLEPDNIQALYLKTKAFQENPASKTKSVKEWLRKRGLAGLDVMSQLTKAIQEKKSLEKARGKSNVESNWWQFNEQNFTDLDIHCLKHLSETN